MKAELLKNVVRDGKDVAQYEARQGEMMDGAVLKQGKEGVIPGVLRLGVAFDNGVHCMYAYTEGRKSLASLMWEEMDATQMLRILENLTSTLLYVDKLSIPFAYMVTDAKQIYVDPEDGCAYMTCIPAREAKMELTDIPDMFRNILAYARYKEEDAGYLAGLLNRLNRDFNLTDFLDCIHAFMDTRGIAVVQPKKAELKEEGPALSAVVQEEKEEMQAEVQPAVAQPEAPAEAKEPSMAQVVQEEKEAEQPAVAEEPAVAEPTSAVEPVVAETGAIVEPVAVQQDTVAVQPEVMEEQAPEVVPEVAEPMNEQAPEVVPVPVVEAEPAPKVEPVPEVEPAPVVEPVAQAEPTPVVEPAPRATVVNSMDDIEFEPMPEELAAKIERNIGKSAQQERPPVQQVQQQKQQVQQPVQQVQQQKQQVQQPVQQVQQPQPEAATQAPLKQAEAPKAAKPAGPQPLISPQDAGLTPKTPKPHLVRVKTGEQIALPEGNFVIGKSANGTDYIVMDNSAVSRIHCTLIKRGGAYYVRDEHSTNGTFVNRERLADGEEKLLLNDTTLVLGNEDFIYSLW